MRDDDKKIKDIIEEVLSSQRLAVLATERGGQPYSSLMAFAHSSDLSTIAFATGKATRKHINLMQETRVSLLIDTRSNTDSDFHSATAITLIGKARLPKDEELVEYEKIYIDKHPYLEKFLDAPTTSLFLISVHHYLIVNRFQNVIEYHLTNETDIFT